MYTYIRILLLNILTNIKGLPMQTGNGQIITFIIAMTIVLVLLMAIIITMLYIHQNRRIVFHEQLANTQLEIQEETFQHISREIHDNIGLSLTLAKLHLNTLDIKSQQQHYNNIKSSVELISQAITDLSHISKSLDSETIKSEGFQSALQIKLDKIERVEKFKIDFETRGNPVFMDSQSELIIYRIIQEALNNIIKHSRATRINILLTYTERELIVKLQDNGIGISWPEYEKNKSLKMSAGINNMKRRAKMINGACEIKSNNTGTTVLVTIPLQTK